MTKILLDDLATLTNEQSALSAINSNYQTIEDESDNFLSRDGTTPNSMEADLDMDSNRIINLPAASDNTEPVRYAEFASAIADGGLDFPLTAPGLVTVTDSETATVRTLTGTAGEIEITNGTGGSGNPTVGFASSIDFTGHTISGLTEITLSSSGLHILDADASHDMIITTGSSLAADRLLSINPGDAARTITLSGNPTLSDWFDQSVKVAASPTFAGLTLSSPLALTQGGTGGTSAETAVDNITAGVKQTLWIPATAMEPRITNGPARGKVKVTTNEVILTSLDFDASTDEYAQFMIAMPKGWNESTISFIPYWSHSGGANFTVSWELRALSFSNDETMDTAFGSATASADTGGTTNDIYIGPESTAITIGSSPAEGDLVVFEIFRNTGSANDALTVDARLHGIKILYTLTTLDDA